VLFIYEQWRNGHWKIAALARACLFGSDEDEKIIVVSSAFGGGLADERRLQDPPVEFSFHVPASDSFPIHISARTKNPWTIFISPRTGVARAGVDSQKLNRNSALQADYHA
jgi:hypothetical protein